MSEKRPELAENDGLLETCFCVNNLIDGNFLRQFNNI